MSLLLIDGFDSKPLNTSNRNTIQLRPEWLSGTGFITNEFYRLPGTQSLKNPGALTTVIAAGQESATFIIGFALATNNTSNSASNMYVRFCSNKSSVVQAQIEILTALNRINVFRSTGTLIANTIAPFNAAIWNYFEFKLTLGNSGAYEVRINGVTVLSGTGNTLANSSFTTLDSIIVDANYINTGPVFLDDLYLINTGGSVNNTFLGDIFVNTLFPAAQGSYQNGSVVGAPNAVAALSDQNQSTYVTLSGEELKNTFTYTTFPESSVFGISIVTEAMKTGSAPRFITPITVLSGVVASGSTGALSQGGYTQYIQLYETHPVTSGELTADSLQETEFGFST